MNLLVHATGMLAKLGFELSNNPVIILERTSIKNDKLKAGSGLEALAGVGLTVSIFQADAGL